MSLERIPEGDDVVAFLDSLGTPTGTWVTGAGTLTDVVLATLTAEGETFTEYPGKSQLLALAGRVDGALMVTVVVAGTKDVRGGRLASGKASEATVHVTEPAAKQGAAPKPPTAPRKAAPNDDDEADEAPKFGDRVDHFVFGLCDVMVVREERMKIRDIAGGKLREIHLGAVKVLKPTIEGGQRVFKLVRK
ncbi:MAG TPA: hypothetical protein VH062_17750 [Polyangiaceae bacterium]|jgi:hypothetical protein|nr:hypothetical protein [Polyangiaceae bacterium]